MPAHSACDFKAIVGRSRPPNAAFLSSLQGNACYKAAAAHWLAAVLPLFVTKVVGDVFVPIRLIMFVLLPSMMLENAVENGEATFFLLPLQAGDFLRCLLAKGLPSTPLSSPLEAQSLVVQFATQLTPAERALSSAGVQVIASAGTCLEGLSVAR
jgi:hypothetical protein